MARTFRKMKLVKALEREKEKEKPRLKTLSHKASHRAEAEEIDKIFYCLAVSNRRKTAYRKILGLDAWLLEKNIYLISEKLLGIIVEFQPTGKLFYGALKRLATLRNGKAIHQLLFDYFQAAVLCQADYEALGDFILKNTPSLLAGNKEHVRTFLKQGSLLSAICGLRDSEPCAKADFKSRICLLRDRCIVDQ
jgi:hypothetical protein